MRDCLVVYSGDGRGILSIINLNSTLQEIALCLAMTETIENIAKFENQKHNTLFSKEESRQLRQEFWTSFGKSFPRNLPNGRRGWLLYDTKIKGVAFKSHFDTKSALIALDLEDDLENRINCWEKLVALKGILKTEYLPDAIFEEEYYLKNGKEISRIYVPLEKKVSIHNKNTWRDVMEFFNKNMRLIEAFFEDYQALIKA